MNLAQKIGFDRVRAQVVDLCTTASGVEKLLSERFSTNEKVVESRLKPCFELRNVLMMETGFPAEEFVDSAKILSKLAIEGAFLETEQLVDLRSILSVIAEIKDFFEQREQYPTLSGISQRVESFA